MPESTTADVWDAIFVESLDTVNRALARATNVVIRTFSITESDFNAQGLLGVWSIVTGGSGEFINLCLPITGGKMILSPERSVDLAAWQVVLRLPLRWIERQDTSRAMELAFDLRKVAQNGKEDSTSITVVSVSHPSGAPPAGKLLTPLQSTTLGYAIARYISAHASEVSFVFAGLNPLTLGSAKLRAVTTAYVYLDQASDAAAALAVLIGLTERDITAESLRVDPTLRPRGGDNATMVLAGPQLMRYAVAPAIAAALQVGADRLATDDNGLIRSSGSIGDITSVTASLRDGRLSVAFQGSTSKDIGRGVTMNYEVNCEFEVKAALPALALTFKKLQSTSSKTVEKEWWLKILEGIAGESAQSGIDAALSKTTDDLTSQIEQRLSSIAPIDLHWLMPSGGMKLSLNSCQVANALILRGTLN